MEAGPLPLTPRQWALYRLLRDYDTTHTRYWSQREIYDQMQQDLFTAEMYPWDGVADFHGAVGRQISDDIQALNCHPDIQKIILTTSAGHKLATEVEYREFSTQRWIEIKKRIQRQVLIDKKAGLDGQMKLIFNDQSKARDYFETFVPDEHV